MTDLIAKINNLPPVSWLVRLFEFLGRPLDRLWEALAQPHYRRRAAEYRELAATCRRVGLVESAATMILAAEAVERRITRRGNR